MPAPSSSSRLHIRLNPTWLVVLPLGGWVILTLYLPVFGGLLSQAETWEMTLLLLVLAGLSIAAHLAGHLWAARALGMPLPDRIGLFLFGDTAQSWPGGSSACAEIRAALAGPALNLLLAGAAFLVWNAQINPTLNLCMLFTAGCNAWLFAINLIPAFPFDGGRILRALLGWLGLMPARAARFTTTLGFLTAGFLTAWSLFLMLGQARFSFQTSLVTLLFAGLIAIGLGIEPAARNDTVPVSQKRRFTPALQGLIGAGTVLVLSLLPASLLLTNDGIEAPGLALPVEPMISVPAQYLHAHAGSFILTSVLSHAPITAGEWAVSRFNPAIQILPADQVVPENSSPQEQALQGYQMLDDSEATAVVVGMRLAGYPATLAGKGAQIVDFTPGSPAKALLAPGDVITALNGRLVQTSADLIAQMKTVPSLQPVRLEVLHDKTQAEVAVPLMPPSSAGDPPRLGISIQTAGLETHLPFPVAITPQKIVGGPSAGLMFTLTVYNLLTPEDLADGQKIAGTGTINPDGTVGPIGGVGEKVAAAEAAGAAYFLSPVENYAGALAAAKKIHVVQIATAEQAVEFLRKLAVQ